MRTRPDSRKRLGSFEVRLRSNCEDHNGTEEEQKKEDVPALPSLATLGRDLPSTSWLSLCASIFMGVECRPVDTTLRQLTTKWRHRCSVVSLEIVYFLDNTCCCISTVLSYHFFAVFLYVHLYCHSDVNLISYKMVTTQSYRTVHEKALYSLPHRSLTCPPFCTSVFQD